MRRSSSNRDGFSSSFGQSGSSDSLSTAGTTTTNSASLAKAERQIQALEAENKKLRQDFSEMSSMYHQLVSENKHERFDERRIILIKSQIIQLERQIISLSNALSSRSAALMEIENALSRIADCLRSHIDEGKTGGATIPRTELNTIIETAESARIKLYKSIENSTSESLKRPLMMIDKFIKPSHSQAITLLDVCSGQLEHLNLKEISKLESDLAELYKQLMLVNTSLNSIVITADKPANREVPAALYERLGGEVSQACNLLISTNNKLLHLSLLIPAAPWPPIQKPRIAELTTDHVMKCIPSFSRSKATEGRQMIEALLKSFTYEKHMQKLQNQILTDDLNFHQNVYDLQQDYIQTLFTAVKEGYSQFEEGANSLIREPLFAVLSRFSLLKDTASEDALREFLSVFKQHANQLEEAVALLEPGNNDGGKEVLSQFGEDFLKSLDQLHQGCRLKRDTAINELDEIKTQRQAHLEVMRELFTPPEKQDPDPKQEYENIIKDTTNLNISEDIETPSKEKSSPSRSRPSKRVSDVRGVSNTNGRRRSSLGPSLKQDPPADKEPREGEEGNSGDTVKKPAKRPASIGRMSSNMDSSRLVSPKHSQLPMKRDSTPQSSSGGRSVRSSMIPAPSPTHTPKSRPPPGGRLTPIQKLKLKPRSGVDVTPPATPETSDVMSKAEPDTDQ